MELETDDIRVNWKNFSLGVLFLSVFVVTPQFFLWFNVYEIAVNGVYVPFLDVQIHAINIATAHASFVYHAAKDAFVYVPTLMAAAWSLYFAVRVTKWKVIRHRASEAKRN